MKKKGIIFLLFIILLSNIIIGCQKEPIYEKYSYTFYDTFDTITTVVGYTETEEEFQEYATFIENRMTELDKLFDKYHTYPDMNNVKTINDYAGIKPIKVQKELIDLIQFSKEWYQKTNQQTNIALGAVLDIWSKYREEGKEDPKNAKIPSMEELKKANQHTNLDKVIVNTKNNTVFLKDSEMSLDVGAVAKGFALELVVDEVSKKGFTSGVISAGGNVRTIGKPLDGVRDRWGVGIQNPDKALFEKDGSNILETIFVNDTSVVTSGDYQRYYVVNGKVMHHLIDPDTLMPGKYYRSVTIVTNDSGLGDFLSTTLFLLPFEEGKKLVNSLEGVEALWVMKNGEIKFSDGMKQIMKSQGASGRD